MDFCYTEQGRPLYSVFDQGENEKLIKTLKSFSESAKIEQTDIDKLGLNFVFHKERNLLNEEGNINKKKLTLKMKDLFKNLPPPTNFIISSVRGITGLTVFQPNANGESIIAKIRFIVNDQHKSTYK